MDSKTTRRAFVASTVASAATVSIMSSKTALGTEANSRVRVANIGLGGRGTMITNMFNDHDGFEVAAVCDYFPEVATKTAERLGLPADRAFSGLKGYQRILDADIVDAMVLKTPTYCFPEHARASVEAGKHVYMAKPIATDVPGSLSIGESGKMATERGQVFLVDFQLRVDPYLQECVKRIRDGAMGDIRFMRVFYDDEGRADPPMTGNMADRFRNLIWTMNVALGGDRIVAAGIHAVDAMLWIAGELPESCVGAARISRENPHGDSTDTYSLTYRFPSGLVANYSGDQFRNHKGFLAGCDAFGWHSYMETRYAGETWMRGDDWRYEGGEKPDLYQYGARTNIDTFHKSIVGGKCDNPTVEPSVQANLAAILGREAGRRGTLLTWDELIRENKAIVPDLSGLVE